MVKALHRLGRERAPHSQFKVETWDKDGNSTVKWLAGSNNTEIAMAACEAALLVRPGDRITLRNGTRLMRERKAP